MKTVLFLAVSLLGLAWFPTSVFAEELRVFSWSDPEIANRLSTGEVLPAEPPRKGEILKIENSTDSPNQIQLLEIKDLSITEPTYAISGDIRYEDVKGTGYLEMWNYFPDGSQYFSRTLGDQGPMKCLLGSSDWRPFVLPFFIGEENAVRPNRLVVNLVLEGSGTVYLSPLRLEQHVDQQLAMLAPSVWWGPKISGLIMGILGGSLGGLSGLCSILANRGRARRFTMIFISVSIFIGIIMSILGIVALLASQPYEVWFPLFLVGVVIVAVFIPSRVIVRRRYENWELQQISVTDLGMTSS